MGLDPLRLEDRFEALEVSSEPETNFEIENEGSLPRVGQCSQNALNERVDGVDEFSVGISATSAPWRLGDRPVDLTWPPRSLVKWKDPKHPGFF